MSCRDTGDCGHHLCKTIADLQRQLAEAREQKDILNAEIDKHRNSAGELARELGSVRVERDEYSARVASLSSLFMAAEKERDNALQDCRVEKQAFQETHDMLGEVQQELVACKKERDEWKHEAQADRYKDDNRIMIAEKERDEARAALNIAIKSEEHWMEVATDEAEKREAWKSTAKAAEAQAAAWKQEAADQEATALQWWKEKKEAEAQVARLEEQLRCKTCGYPLYNDGGRSEPELR